MLRRPAALTGNFPCRRFLIVVDATEKCVDRRGCAR
jgi:hypothetical protein